MNRRDFLAGAATGAVVAGGATYAAVNQTPAPVEPGTTDEPGAAPAVAKDIREWRMVTSWPKNFPGPGTSAQEMADLITSMSDGRLVVKLFAAGELVPAFEVFDAVREGTAELGHSAPYYWVAKNKSLAFFCAVPGGLTQIEHNAWVEFAGGQELWDELYAEFGLKGFMAGNTGVQMGGWFQREIRSVEDFKGLKFRIPGLAAEVVNRMGGTAVNMPGGEIMPALESGVIDAAEWVGPWNDLAFGFYKVAKYYYGPGFHEGSTCSELMVNKATYDALPTDLKQVVRTAATVIHMRGPAEFAANNAISLRVLLDEHGVRLNGFPDDVVKSMFRLSDDVAAETADEGEINRRIYQSWSAFRTKAMEYAPLAEFGYSRNRALAYGV